MERLLSRFLTIGCLLCMLCLFQSAVAQKMVPGDSTVITQRDERQIKQNAVLKLRAFQIMLNDIASSEITLDDLNEMIMESYGDPSRKKFYDSTAVLVKDIEEQDPKREAPEGEVRDYIMDFNIFYEKNPTPSVVFNNFRISNIKKGDHLYLKVFYDCQFNGKSKRMDIIPLQKKVANFRIERKGNGWETYIETINFFEPRDSANLTLNDVTIAPDAGAGVSGDVALPAAANTVDTTATLRPRTVLTEEEKEKIRQQNDEIAAHILLDTAETAFGAKDYYRALKNYTYAQKLDLTNPYLKAQIDRCNRLIAQQNITPEQQYEAYNQQATLAMGQHDYDLARVSYDKALAIKASESERLKPIISDLTAKLLLLNRIRLKFEDSNYKGALDEAKNATLKYPADPVFLLSRARAYEYLDDNKQARKDYAKAIDLDKGYLQAYQLRGDYYERQKDFNGALSDYEVICQSDKTNDTIYLKTYQLQVDKGDITRAIGELNKGIAINPERVVFYQKKGELEYLDNHDPATAISDFGIVLQKDSSQATGWYYHGLCQVDLGHVEAGAHNFDRARSLNLESSLNQHLTDLSVGYYVKGLAAYNGLQTDSALRNLTNAILIDPSRDNYRFKRGECYYRMGDYPTAIVNYTDAIYLNKRNDTAYQQRGRAEYNLAAYDKTVADLDSSIAINPQVPEKYKYRADGNFQQGQFDKAIRDYDEVQPRAKLIKEELPDTLQATINNYRGESYYQTGNYTVALENFKTAQKFNKAGNPDILFNRGKTFLKLNDLKDAFADVSMAVGQHPGNAIWDFTLGEIDRMMNNYQPAVTAYSAALAVDPTSIPPLDPLHKRAVCWVNLQAYDSALVDYRSLQARSLDAQYPAFNDELGNVFRQKMQPDSAEVYFNKSLVKDPTDADALYGMGAASVQFKQMDIALVWFDKAFATGKIKKPEIKEDKTIDDIRNDKRFKALLKKYGDQLSK